MKTFISTQNNNNLLQPRKYIDNNYLYLGYINNRTREMMKKTWK